MTDQYKELREIAENFALDGQAWAKQALQLLEEMDAVGAGGVSGKSLTKAGYEKIAENEKHVELMRGGQIVTPLSVTCFDIGYNYAMKQMQSWGPWTGPFNTGVPALDLIQGEEMMIDAGMSKLYEWVDLINRADDETKDILRQGLKEEIELMFSRSIEVAPTNDGWVEWNGGGMPIPLGVKVDVRHRSGSTYLNCTAGVAGSYAETWWHNECPMDYDIIAYRIVK